MGPSFAYVWSTAVQLFSVADMLADEGLQLRSQEFELYAACDPSDSSCSGDGFVLEVDDIALIDDASLLNSMLFVHHALLCTRSSDVSVVDLVDVHALHGTGGTHYTNTIHGQLHLWLSAFILVEIFHWFFKLHASNVGPPPAHSPPLAVRMRRAQISQGPSDRDQLKGNPQRGAVQICLECVQINGNGAGFAHTPIKG